MTVPWVTHVLISLDHGGLERQVLAWARERNRLHPDSTSVLCLDHIGNLADAASGLHVVCVRANRRRFPWDCGAVERIRIHLREEGRRGGTVITNTHNLAAWQYGVLAARGTGVRVVHTHHGANLHDWSWMNRQRTRWLARHSDAIVAVSDETARVLSSMFAVPAGAIRVVANGIDVDHYHHFAKDEERVRLRQELGIPAHVPVIGTVGRLAYVKGPDRLLRAFAELKRTATTSALLDTHLLLVGDGPMRDDLEQQVLDSGVDPMHVHIVGFQPDPRPFLAAMDLFVLPSRSEGLPLALLEAMAMGLPCMATDVGANASLLKDGVGHLLDEDEASWPANCAAVLQVVGGGVGGGLGGNQVASNRVYRDFSVNVSTRAYNSLYGEVSGSVTATVGNGMGHPIESAGEVR